MNTSTLQSLSDTAFKRLLGVSRATFAEMLTVLQGYQPTRGRPPKLSFESQLLLTLTYWRDYPSLFKLGIAYGVSEASAWRIVRRVEDQLIQSGVFSLPTRHGTAASVIVVDATDIRVERPKKTMALVQR